MVQVQPPTPKPQEIVSFSQDSQPIQTQIPEVCSCQTQISHLNRLVVKVEKLKVVDFKLANVEIYPQWQKGRPNSAAYLLPTNMGKINITWPFLFFGGHGSDNYHISNFQIRKQSNIYINVGLIGWTYSDFLFSWMLFQRCFCCFFFFAAPSAQSVRFVSRRNFRLPCGTNSPGSLQSVPWKNLSIWKEQGGRTMWNIGVKVKMWSSQNRSQNIVWNHTAINNPRLVSHLNHGGSTSDLVDSLDQKGTMPGRHSAIPDPTTRAVGLRNMMVKFIVSSIKIHPI